MAAAGVWEICYLRHGLEWVFHPETQVVSSFEFPVSKGVRALLGLNIERHEYSGNPTAIARDTAQVLSSRGHVISHGLQGPLCQRCQRTGCNAEGSRKQRRTVAWKATVLTNTAHIVTVSIWDLRLYGCNGKQLALGTQVQETWRGSLDLDACWRNWGFATVVFCWILMTTAAYFQANTSDSENILSSHVSRAAKMYLRCVDVNDLNLSTTTPHCNRDVMQSTAVFLLHF